jgi:hypothetical protein
MILNVVMPAFLSRGPGPDWQKTIEERGRLRREEAARLDAYHQQQERQAEKRRETELRETQR